MRRAAIAFVLVTIAAFLPSGCGDFQQRAQEAEARIADAEESAQVASQAAARNTGRILELKRRVDELEGALAEMLEVVNEDANTP